MITDELFREGDLVSLKNCSLANYAFRLSTLSHIFNEMFVHFVDNGLSLDNSDDDELRTVANTLSYRLRRTYVDFFDFLKAAPHIANVVKTLSLARWAPRAQYDVDGDIPEDLFCNILHLLPNLDKLELRNVLNACTEPLGPLPARLSSLTTLRLDVARSLGDLDHPWGSRGEIGDVFFALRLFSHVEHLIVKLLPYVDAAWEEPFPTVARSLAPKTLVLLDTDESLRERFMDLGPLLRRIETLRLDTLQYARMHQQYDDVDEGDETDEEVMDGEDVMDVEGVVAVEEMDFEEGMQVVPEELQEVVVAANLVKACSDTLTSVSIDSKTSLTLDFSGQCPRLVHCALHSRSPLSIDEQGDGGAPLLRQLAQCPNLQRLTIRTHNSLYQSRSTAALCDWCDVAKILGELAAVPLQEIILSHRLPSGIEPVFPPGHRHEGWVPPDAPTPTADDLEDAARALKDIDNSFPSLRKFVVVRAAPLTEEDELWCKTALPRLDARGVLECRQMAYEKVR